MANTGKCKVCGTEGEFVSPGFCSLACMDAKSDQIMAESPEREEKQRQMGRPPLFVLGEEGAVGWMVSFDFNPSGEYYAIQRGKTSIGKSKDNDVSLFHDALVSDEHAYIRYWRGVCAVCDIPSIHATKLNGEDIGLGVACKLTNGDTLTIGATTFHVTLPNQE